LSFSQSPPPISGAVWLAALSANHGLRRADRPHPLKVIDVDHAFVGLHPRTVVLASPPALSLFSDAEFAALVAHELGHEFVWSVHWDAMHRHDHHAMRELELRCDAIACSRFGRSAVMPTRSYRPYGT
jgi:hypothetical protein